MFDNLTDKKLGDLRVAISEAALEIECITGKTTTESRNAILTGSALNELTAWRRCGLSLSRAKELGKADAEERVAILPCKVGDTAYVITTCENVFMQSDNDYFDGTSVTECPLERYHDEGELQGRWTGPSMERIACNKYVHKWICAEKGGGEDGTSNE